MAMLLTRNISLGSLITLFCLIATVPPAIAYSDNGDGSVTDPTTALTWMRCSMGQTWNGSTCTGAASAYTWSQAVAMTGTVSFAGNGYWRLPDIRELQTIVDWSRSEPPIDPTAFPNTPVSSFWSASAYAGDSGSAWVDGFDVGYATGVSKSSAYPVRLVRAGQSFSAQLNPARPTVDYVDHGDGTVTHTPTGLTWQRCVKGQSWAGNTCSGNVTYYNWDAAVALTDNFAGYVDWRLPTVVQLLTLADYSLSNFALNAAMFPAEPESDLWSASAYAGNSSSAWGINFHYGNPNFNGKAANYAVRLVRTGAVATTLNVVGGWNLLGNSTGSPISVATTFGDAAKITTVWKWIANTSRWAFYSPSLAGQALTNYANANNYDVLTTITSGEGFWVNAKTGITVQLPTGTSVTSASFQVALTPGWQLIATGDNKTPRQFDQALSPIPPGAGEIPINFTSLWAWDAAQNKWYFYAPSLDKNSTLASYVRSKGYLEFGAKVLDPATGFWVNISTPVNFATTTTATATVPTTTTTSLPTTSTTSTSTTASPTSTTAAPTTTTRTSTTTTAVPTTTTTSTPATTTSTASTTSTTTTSGSSWANWSCGSSSQCASVMGGYTGSAGPMCSLNDCNAWGIKYIPYGYACAAAATYARTVGTPSNGVCYRSGADF